MAAIEHTLQREIFTPNDEKLLSTLIIYQIKKNDKNVYKKNQSWLLNNVQVVDGVKNNSMDMELHIDKIYHQSIATPTLDQMIKQLDISDDHLKILNEAELPSGHAELIVAGTALLKAITAPLPPGLDKLSAVSEQKRRLEKLKAKFSQLVARHLNNLFIHLGNDVGDTMFTSELILLMHSSVHRELEPYTELMQLLRSLDNKTFVQLTKV